MYEFEGKIKKKKDSKLNRGLRMKNKQKKMCSRATITIQQ